MNIEKTFQNLCDSLTSIYDKKEAKSIARIVFEDAFQIFNFERKDEFPQLKTEKLEAIKTRLLRHEPIQYILGEADFYGFKFKVNGHVLIPRQETEELVYWILEDNLDTGKELNVLDIGTGTGCIPITLKIKRPNWKIEAIDISENALKIAQENASKYAVDVEFYVKNILDEVDGKVIEKYDVIVSNPPYIPKNETYLMPKQVVDFEPQNALFVQNEDPLIFYRKITKFAFQNLKKEGLLYFETNEYNAKKVVKLIDKQGFRCADLKQDMSGKDRMIKARK